MNAAGKCDTDCGRRILYRLVRQLGWLSGKDFKLTKVIRYIYNETMFITKESDYAVRIIRELAGGERETVETIAKKERIPYQYCYKILKKLEKSGLVRSYRGINGGYSLAKQTGAMTLLDVVRSVDGDILFTECLRHDFNCPMNQGGKQCMMYNEFARIQALILAGLKEKPLAEILQGTSKN
jgi:Rrf2 family protein